MRPLARSRGLGQRRPSSRAEDDSLQVARHRTTPAGNAPARWPRFWKAKSWPGLRPAETRSKKGVNRGHADLEMVKPLVKLPRLDSNQQPFG